MKKIKIFIASSAELNEDKQMFDLYFSDKNKLYRDRNIDFDQRTWMDFSSSLNEGRLQDRYNDYIRECDIVIFLFHTRMGRYTKEELEVAHEIYLKTKAAKPKIFVYFKEEGIVDESLKDFKSYCEKNLGHFCDLYTNYDDLRLKFDKQLQILENEGFIKPDPVDVKRTLRFVLLYVLVPVLVVALAFFAFYYYSPVTSTVRLTDTSKSSLPFYGADITLEYADKSETRHVDRLSDEVVFKEIHTKYLGENARLKIESKGYVTVDTVLSLEKNVTLGISRDSSLAMIFGTVKDEDNRPLADATVQVLDMKTVSDGMGNFQLPPVAAYQMPIDLHGAGIIHGPEVQQHPAALPRRRGEQAVVVQPLPRLQGAPHPGGRGLRRIGHQNAALPGRRVFGRLGDGILPRAVQDLTAVPAHGRAGIFCKRMHPLTAFCLLAPF